MLPLISDEIREAIFAEIGDDIHSWRKKMIHYIKEDNPEVNAAIIDAAKVTSLDPKAIATGAYIVYKMIEAAAATLQPEGSSSPDAILDLD